jgi:hypothetical protein
MVDPPPLPASAGGTRAVTTSDDASSAGATHKHSSRKTATSADSTDREIASAATTNQTSTDPTSTNPAAAGPPADLARLLIRDPGHTVLLRVAGASMQGAGIQHGDLLVVDCRRRARAGQVVVALLEGGFTLQRLAWREVAGMLAFALQAPHLSQHPAGATYHARGTALESYERLKTNGTPCDL